MKFTRVYLSQRLSGGLSWLKQKVSRHQSLIGVGLAALVLMTSFQNCGKGFNIVGTSPAEPVQSSSAIAGNSYAWAGTAWATCSQLCGGGSQTRTITCQQADGTVVVNSNCSGTMPASTQACNTQACSSAMWVQGGFSLCSKTCGGGTQTQTVTCKDSSGNTISSSLCTGAAPASSLSCNTQACPTALTFSPSSGPVGTLVTLTGTGLDLSSITSVSIGGVEAVIENSSTNSVQFLVVPFTQTGDVVVKAGTKAFTFSSSPVFTVTQYPVLTTFDCSTAPANSVCIPNSFKIYPTPSNAGFDARNVAGGIDVMFSSGKIVVVQGASDSNFFYDNASKLLTAASPSGFLHLSGSINPLTIPNEITVNAGWVSAQMKSIDFFPFGTLPGYKAWTYYMSLNNTADPHTTMMTDSDQFIVSQISIQVVKVNDTAVYSSSAFGNLITFH